MRDKKEAVQVKCPKCKRTQIVYIPEEDIPDCPDCRVQMNIEELLDEESHINQVGKRGGRKDLTVPVLESCDKGGLYERFMIVVAIFCGTFSLFFPGTGIGGRYWSGKEIHPGDHPQAG